MLPTDVLHSVHIWCAYATIHPKYWSPDNRYHMRVECSTPRCEIGPTLSPIVAWSRWGRVLSPPWPHSACSPSRTVQPLPAKRWLLHLKQRKSHQSGAYKYWESIWFPAGFPNPHSTKSLPAMLSPPIRNGTGEDLHGCRSILDYVWYFTFELISCFVSSMISSSKLPLAILWELILLLPVMRGTLCRQRRIECI